MNIITALEQRFPNAEVKAVRTRKNNGIMLHGVAIRENGAQVAPTIYYDENAPEEQQVNYIVKAYKSAKKDAPKVDLSLIADKDKLLQNVVPQLISRERNVDRLLDLIHEPMLDMEIVFKVIFDSEYKASLLVSTDIERRG